MAHDVFVSYSVKDKVVADAIVARLEADAIRCWVPPRDVVPGADWGESIINAIESSRIMVLVFTSSANASPQIKREIERAVDKGVYTIPVRIENIEPTKSLEYFISTSQWMDAFPPPMEPHLDFMSKTVKAILAGRPPPLPPPPPPPPPTKRQPIIWIAAAALVILVGVGWFFFTRPTRNEGERRPEPGPAPTATAAAPTATIAAPTATAAAPTATITDIEEEIPSATPEATSSVASRTAIPQISGHWHESEDLDSHADIRQQGNRFSFVRWGTLPNGTQFKGSGTGELFGLQFRSGYQSAYFSPPWYQMSAQSSGECTGSVSADGKHMKLKCNDSMFGPTEGEAYRAED